MSEPDTIEDHHRLGLLRTGRGIGSAFPAAPAIPPTGVADLVTFSRDELREIFNLYGRKVANGEWRDYAIDFAAHKAVFSIYRKATEYALYSIEKQPALARRHGLYSVITTTGLILRRGSELGKVIAVLDKKIKLVAR
ncbi:MAG TPA: DUF2794 domain-containing protein [Methylocella sp.]|nr:DUF2794 domain-containing protein [Methylocella sp.]